MIKKQLARLLSRVNKSLRRTCEALTEKKRLIIASSLCLTLGIGSLYITAGSIYSACKKESGNRYLKPEHYIKRVKLQVSDSIMKLIEKKDEK